MDYQASVILLGASMTPEEQRKLAIECCANVSDWIRTGNIRGSYISITFTVNELAAYTAAVEAKERERCAAICDDHHHMWRFGDGDDSVSGPKECAAAIRSL